MTDLRLVRANGIRLAYRESGSPAAPPVVLLHALGENSADWGQVAAARLVTIPAGHLVHAARPDAFLSAVTRFLGS